MRTFRFNKLVRDKIVARQQEEGGKPDYRVLEDKEYLQALKAKILEEAQEMELSNVEDLVSELADLQEVIDCMLEAIGKTKADVARVQTKKNAKAGSFKQKLFVDTVQVADDSKWIPYYLKNADRYPEVEEQEND